MRFPKAMERAINGETVTCQLLADIDMVVCSGHWEKDGVKGLCMKDLTGDKSPYIASELTGLYSDDWAVVK